MRTPPKTVLWVAFWIGVASTLAAAAQFRRPKCGPNEFKCTNQERCIHEFDKCDGKKDCSDGSDETQALCWQFGMSCGASPFSFKCTYGACVDKTKECDGKEYDCADNSDEAHCYKTSDTPEITSRCQSFEFTCISGNCVNLTDVCDGTPNCKDKSDETIAQCNRMTCPHFSFQCAYGACIDWEMRCDGQKDCADGSDEANDLCNKPVDTPADVNKADDSNSTGDTCPFPTHEHTRYEFGCSGSACQELVPGMPVKKYQGVKASCPPGYALPYQFSGKKNAMICIAPPKFHTMITCEKMCPPLVSEFHEIECKFKGKSVPCESPMYPGTHVRLECKNYFKPVSDILAVTETRCQADGTWTYGLYKCIPENAGQAERTTASPLGTRVGTPQMSFRLTQRMIVCLALFDAGLLPRVVLRPPTTTPSPIYYLEFRVSRPKNSRTTPSLRVRRQTLVTRYHHIIQELNSFASNAHNPIRSPIDAANQHIKSIRSVLLELQSLFPEERSSDQKVSEQYNDDMEELMERQHLIRGLATCSLIDDVTLLGIIDNLERKFDYRSI